MIFFSIKINAKHLTKIQIFNKSKKNLFLHVFPHESEAKEKCVEFKLKKKMHREINKSKVRIVQQYSIQFNLKTRKTKSRSFKCRQMRSKSKAQSKISTSKCAKNNSKS